MIEAIVRGSVRHRFFVVVVCAMLAALGLWAWATLPVDAIPDLTDVQVIIVTDWEGQNPQVIEDQVTYPISSAMLNVPRLKSVRGFSFFGVSFVYVVFEDGTDIYWARSRVLEFLAQVTSRLPEGARARLGPDATGLGWVYMYVLEDPTGTFDLGELRALQDWVASYILRAVPGVSEVASVGGAPRRYEIVVDPLAAEALGVTVPQIAEAVRQSNADAGGMVVEAAEREYMVRGRGYVRGGMDLEDVVLKVGPGGAPVRVRDVAQVAIAPDVVRGITDWNGRGEQVAGIVVMRYQENARRVIENVERVIREQVRPALPPGIQIHTAYDRRALIERSMRTLRDALVQELLVLAALMIVFLLHVRSALVGFAVLPLGGLLSITAMRLAGINANIMSVAGIAIAFGTMVDGSIVIVENVLKRLEAGGDRVRIIMDACCEVAPGIFFSLLVVVAGFLPIFGLVDQAGRLFQPLAFTKTFAMFAASALAITLIPAVVGYVARGRIVPEEKNPFAQMLIRPYGPVVRFAMRYPILTVGVAAGLVALTVVPFSQLGSEFMPPLEEGDLLYMPTSVPGLGVTEARRVLAEQDRLLMTFPEVRTVLGKAGRSTTATDPAPLEMVETTAQLYPEEEWPERRVPVEWLADVVRRAGADEKMAREIAAMAAPRIDERIRLALAERTADEPPDVRLAVARKWLRVLRPQIAHWVAEVLDSFGVRVVVEEVPLVRAGGFADLTREMNGAIQIAGMPNWFLMPIQTRMGMVTTGMRGELGLKVYGTDYGRVERLAVQLEQVLRNEVPNTISAVADRLAEGGTYLDVEIDREACARYGLRVEDVQEVVRTAIGGMEVTRTVEGRYRFPVVVRYPRELRDDPERLRRVSIPRPGGGAPVTLGQVARIRIVPGPMAIRSEDNRLVIYLPVAFEGVTPGEYVRQAKRAIERAVADGRVEVSPGYGWRWSGQYEMMEETNRRLWMLGALALALIFLVLYLYFQRVVPVVVVMVATLLFAPVGGAWLMWLMGFDLSTAVWVGFIAEMGLAAETAVIMFVYLDNARKDRERRFGRLTPELLDEAIEEGATLRVRPKMMTVLTDLFGVLPMFWATGAGAATLSRMAAPLAGGIVSSMILTLVVIPAVYKLMYLPQTKKAVIPEGGAM